MHYEQAIYFRLASQISWGTSCLSAHYCRCSWDSGVGTTGSSVQGMRRMNRTGGTKGPKRTWTLAGELCVCVCVILKHFTAWGVFRLYPFNAGLLRNKSSLLLRPSISRVKDVKCMRPLPIFSGLFFFFFLSSVLAFFFFLPPSHVWKEVTSIAIL